ncbi:MAG: MoxR family ATPase [Nanoarchaeota archaeon]|nr:MoxR family ATPase [Nanoarchaeota archaeon]
MSVTFKSFLGCYKSITTARLPIMLRSRHGQGKSSVVYQIAEELGLPVVERRASQMTEGDLLGLPKIDGDRTEYLPPSWLKTACDEPVLLFVDEIDRATQEVRQGFFELTDSRKISGNHLHPDTLVFAAVNGGEHTAQYQVGELDPAELDRWVVFDVEPSVEDWLTWAKEKVNPIIWDFINTNHNHLEHKGDFEPNKVYPSRRSWHRLSNTLNNAKVIEAGKPNPTLYNISCAFVGLEASIALQDFVKNYQAIVTPEDILDNGKVELTSKWGISEHTAFLDKCEAAGIWKKELSSVQIDNLALYFLVLPSEPAMKLFTNLSEGSINNVIELHGRPSISQKIVNFLTTPKVEKKEEEKTEEKPAPKKRGRPKKTV